MKKKGKSHIWPRMKTIDEKAKGKRGNLAVLKGMNPVPKEPFAITVQKALKSNDLPATKVFFVSPDPEE